MNPLTEARAALAAALEAASEGKPWTVTDHVPEDVEPPVVIVAPANPFLVPDELYGDQATLRVVLWVIVGAAGDNARTSDEIDDLVLAVFRGIPETWGIPEGFSAPFVTRHNGSDYLALRLVATLEIDLTESE